MRVLALTALLLAETFTLGTWSGDGSKDTETFSTTKAEWRVTWTTTKFLGIVVKSAETNKPVATASGSENGTSMVRVPAGKYYLSISGSAKWTVTADEQR